MTLVATYNEETGSYELVFTRPEADVKNHLNSAYTFAVSTDGGETYDETGVTYTTTAEVFNVAVKADVETVSDDAKDLALTLTPTAPYDGDTFTLTIAVADGDSTETTNRVFTGTFAEDGTLTFESEEDAETIGSITASASEDGSTYALTYTRPTS